MAATPYLQPSEYAAYGIPTATDDQVLAATLTVNTYLGRPEGLLWSPDANRVPAWMTSLSPTLSLTHRGGNHSRRERQRNDSEHAVRQPGHWRRGDP